MKNLNTAYLNICFFLQLITGLPPVKHPARIWKVEKPKQMFGANLKHRFSERWQR